MSRLESNFEPEWVQPEFIKDQPQTSATSPGGFLPAMSDVAIADFENDESSVTELTSNGELLFKNREFQLASHLFLAVLRKDSHHLLAMIRLGDCYFEMEKWSKAEKIYRIAYQQSMEVKAGLRYAASLYHLDQLEESMTLYHELLMQVQDRQELFDAYKTMGNIFLRLGDLDSAEESYHRAFTLNNTSDVLCVNYGTLEIQRGHLERALSRYREALAINPQNDKAWVGLALIHRHYGDHELSWGNLQLALDFNKSNVTALQLMAEWSLKDQKVFEVIERLQDYLRDSDQDAEMSLLLAKLFFIINRADLAAIEVTRALSIDPLVSGGREMIQSLKNHEAPC